MDSRWRSLGATLAIGYPRGINKRRHLILYDAFISLSSAELSLLICGPWYFVDTLLHSWSYALFALSQDDPVSNIPSLSTAQGVLSSLGDSDALLLHPSKSFVIDPVFGWLFKFKSQEFNSFLTWVLLCHSFPRGTECCMVWLLPEWWDWSQDINKCTEF